MAEQIKLRPYQERIDKKQRLFMDDPDRFRAIVTACTGSGKTINFFKLIIDETLMRKAKGEKMQVLLVHPRLALDEAQQKRAHETLCNYDLTYQFAIFHTGATIHSPSQKSPDGYRRPIQTTKLHALEDDRRDCTRDLHITWTTYHSLEHIAHIHYDLIICDEAHYLLQKKFRPNVAAFGKRVKTLFYTATPVGAPGFLSERTTEADPNEEDDDNDGDLLDPDDKGMGDEEVFGEIIETVPPKELIPDGYVVPPLIQIMDVATEKGDANDTGITRGFGDAVGLAKMIGLAYNGQLQLEEVNKNFNHKMMVVMPGVRMFPEIMENRQIIIDEVGKHVDVYAVSANWHAKNSTARSAGTRGELIEDFALTANPAVILHFDTIAEGIDVDGIGGVLFLRKELRKVKSLQTIGRACRPAKADLLEDGTVRKEGKAKTHAVLTLVNVDDKAISQKRLEEWSIFFEEAGYEHLWAYVPKEKNRVEPGDPLDEPPAPPPSQLNIRYAWFKRLARERANQLRFKFGLDQKYD